VNVVEYVETVRLDKWLWAHGFLNPGRWLCQPLMWDVFMSTVIAPSLHG